MKNILKWVWIYFEYCLSMGDCVSDTFFDQSMMSVLCAVEQSKSDTKCWHAVFKLDKIKDLFFRQFWAWLSQLLTTWESNEVCGYVFSCRLGIDKFDIITYRLIRCARKHLDRVPHVEWQLNKDCQVSQDSIDMHSVIELRVDELPKLFSLITPARVSAKKKAHAQ